MTPQEYEVEIEGGPFSFDVLSATAQKQSQGNEELTVQILTDGEVVKEQTTTASFGVVTLSANSQEIREAED